MAAVRAAEAIGAIFARRVDKTVGKLKLSLSQASMSYFKLADRLQLEANSAGVAYAGGVSISDVRTEREDSDRPAPVFELDQFDFNSDSTGRDDVC